MNERLAVRQSVVDRASATDLRLAPMPVLGFRNYWYPVMFSRLLGTKSVSKVILGEEIILIRVNGKPRAIQGRCPHRGARMVTGRCLVPGVLTCPYHGFSFDLETGACVAALTEGPSSTAPQHLKARVYPAEERFGLVWVYMGTGTPPPLEEDVPEEFLDPNAIVVGRFSVWHTNWRVSVDNGIDVAHVPFLHRSHPCVRFQKLPSFFRVSAVREGKWLRAVLTEVGFEASFPRIGRWPRDLRFRRTGGPTQTAVRLPGIVRIRFPNGHTHVRWTIAIDEKRSLVLQTLVKSARGLSALLFKLKYFLWIRWLYHVSFQHDDKDVLVHIDRLEPEQLTQSDVIIVQWRRMAQEARGSGGRE